MRELRESLAAGCPIDPSTIEPPVSPSASSVEDDPSLLAAVISPTVTHYALPFIAPSIHEPLARAYRLCGDSVANLCAVNAKAAASFGMDVVARAWSTLSATALASLPPTHALARPLAKRILDHFLLVSDLQSVACMSRVLLNPRAAVVTPPAPPPLVASGSATLPLAPPTAEKVAPPPAPEPPTPVRFGKRLFQKSKNRQRADSEAPVVEASPTPPASTSFSNVHLVPSPPASLESPVRGQAANFFAGFQTPQKKKIALSPETTDVAECLIAPEDVSRLISLQVVYADVCLLAGLYSHRAQMLHTHLHTPYLPRSSTDRGLSFEPFCDGCSRNMVNTRHCTACNNFLFTCCLCRVPVRGLFSVCSWCGHGGHTRHMIEWFEENEECASGCGCRCGDHKMRPQSANQSPSP